MITAKQARELKPRTFMQKIEEIEPMIKMAAERGAPGYVPSGNFWTSVSPYFTGELAEAYRYLKNLGYSVDLVQDRTFWYTVIRW